MCVLANQLLDSLNMMSHNDKLVNIIHHCDEVNSEQVLVIIWNLYHVLYVGMYG